MAKSLCQPNDPIRVLIIASDNMTGELLASVLSRVRKQFAFATLIGSSQQIVARLKAHNSQVALICSELQDGPQAGYKVLQELRACQHRAAGIMLLQSPNSDKAVDAFRGGARGVFYRSHSLKSLAKCIRAVHEGQIWASNEDIEHALGVLVSLTPLQFHEQNGDQALTPREEDVVRLVAEGLKNRAIADRLHIGEHSVRNYLSRIFEKVGVSSRVELILYQFSRGQSN
jgi:DNA-binding NarL/FixJ family response regulator